MREASPTRLIVQDVRRTTQVLEIAAGDLNDEFLQYLYGMAIIHLNEKLEYQQVHKRSPVPKEVDPLLKNLAKQVLASARR